MGIYSNMAAQLLKEQEVAPDPNAAGLLEFAINSQRAEHAMFETMLELDVAEYYVESGTLVLTEEEKAEGAGNAIKAIGKKIVAAIDKLIQTIVTFLDKIGNLVLEKTKVDKKLIEKYGKKIDLAAAKAKKGDKEITVVNLDAAKGIAAFIGARAAEYKAVSETGSKEDFESKKEAVKKNLDELTGEDKFKAVFSKKKVSELSDADVKDMVDAVDGGYQKLVDSIVGSAAKDTIKALKAAKSEALKKLATPKSETREVDSARFSYVSTLNSAVSKAINFGSNVAAHAMAASRNGFISLAMASKVKEEKKEEAKQEAAEFDYDEILEYAFEVATDNMYSEVTMA